MSRSEGVDAAFIRRGLKQSNLDAVRVALFQNTADPEVGALPPAKHMTAAQSGMLIDKAAAWLAANASTAMPAEPDERALRSLMTMATGRPMNDVEFSARRDLPAFRQYPFAVEWEGERPELPAGFHVAIIGAGFSGLAMAMQCEILGLPYTVYEKQAEIGGTWAINRYPDIRVDTPSITYEYSFEKRYPWSEQFARGENVRQYLVDVAEKYRIAGNVRFEHALVEADFDEQTSAWTLAFDTPKGREVVRAPIVVSASGAFTNPNFARFEGQDTFQGDIVHPARWPADLDLAGKRVGVVGNGSTGVQLLGAIARQANQVYVFQRTPQWISPREGYGQPLSDEVSWLVDNFPGYWNWWRYMATAALFDIHDLQVPDPEWQAQGGKINRANDELRAFLTDYIRKKTGGRQDLIDRLIPDYAPMSRRPVVDHSWYRTLTRDNVELVTTPIEGLAAEGIRTSDGALRPIDVLVSATGYAMTEYLMPSRYVGLGGREIHDVWNAADGPRAYLGMMMPGFPNMFMLFGPNSMPMSGGTGLPQWYMVWSSYIGQCLMRMIRQGNSRVEVKNEAYVRYNRDLDAEASKMIQLTREGGMDHNYYVNAKHGRLQVNAPWQSPEFHRMCTQVAWDDLHFAGASRTVHAAPRADRVHASPMKGSTMPKHALPFPVYDADHHFYDPDDSILRHLPAEYRGDFQFLEVNGARRLAIRGQISRYIPNPTFDKVAAPGSHLKYYKGENTEGLSIRQIGGDPIVPSDSMRHRDARVKWLDQVGVQGALTFPNLFSVIESRMDYDHQFLFAAAHSLNRYIDEEWGFARDGRLFMTPVISLADVDLAVKELDWLLKQGARAVAMSPQPVPGYRGYRSPGDEMFDPFWARIAEAGVFVAYHASDTPYSQLAQWWNRGSSEWTPFKPDPMTACVMMLERAISDTCSALICHGVFDRHPNVRIASVENGATWVGPLLHRLEHVYGMMPQYFKRHPVETFKRHFFITPFTEDSVPELIGHVGVDRVMFGSDWPHPEGLADPLDFVEEAQGLSTADLAKVMGGNLKGLLEGVRD